MNVLSMFIVAILLVGCSSPTPPASTSEPASPRFHLSSPTIVNGKIRDAYDAKGQVVFPDLQWENPPSGTKSFLLIMENKDKDFPAWYCGALGPDKTGLSRGDFEALQNKAGISWTDASKISPGTSDAPGDPFDTIPSKTHQFMVFAPGSWYTYLNRSSRKIEFEYGITLFALKPGVEDWAGDWGNDLLSLSPSCSKHVARSGFLLFGLGVFSKFREKLGGHVLESGELTFRASY